MYVGINESTNIVNSVFFKSLSITESIQKLGVVSSKFPTKFSVEFCKTFIKNSAQKKTNHFGMKKFSQQLAKSFVGRRVLSTDLMAALRPFYLAIRPNRKVQKPSEQLVNEKSFRLLSSHLESLQRQTGGCLPDDGQLEFYMPTSSDPEAGPGEHVSGGQLIRVQLDRSILDPLAVIRAVLKTCKLLPQEKAPDELVAMSQSQNSTQGALAKDPEKEHSLDAWMRQALARTEADDLDTLRAKIAVLEHSLITTLGIRSIRYDCGCNLERYHNCLCDLKSLVNEQPQSTLRNRVVVFASYTGISLEGDVMLFSGDGSTGWREFLAKMRLHEEQLKLVPLYERALSAILLGIQIERRQLPAPGCEAWAYAKSLKRVIRAVSEHLKLAKSVDDLPVTLKNHQLAVVTEAETPKVSQTGLFLAPSSCPGSDLVDFICRNLDVASDRVRRYKRDIAVERQLWRRCIAELELQRLSKDDSVTPDKMVTALQNLLTSEIKSCRGLSLHITNYWSVPTDGIVCIPWDFHKSKEP
ncbi:hypothetical protein KR018_001072 [Drosophila ironensis]|nr:hypothetical protein KR018_001072 [Drosophila ironensis]